MTTISTFYLIRHGETVLNRTDCFRGSMDVDLNLLGRIQAEEAGRALASRRFDAVLSSPLRRAIYTAEQICSHQELRPREEPAFRNIDLGPWNGKPKADVQREEPDQWAVWMTHPEALQVPGAESLRDVQQRAWNRLVQLAGEFRGKTVAIVTHTTVIKPLMARALEVPEPYFWRFHLDHSAYSILEHHSERGWCLVTTNRTDHLTTFRREMI